MIWLGWILWHINHCRLFNAKSSLYILVGFRSLVKEESTYWALVNLLNLQNELMDVHQSDN